MATPSLARKAPLPAGDPEDMTNVLIARISLHRRGDSNNEFRHLDLYQTGRNFALWQSVGFAGDPDIWTSGPMKRGSEHAMRALLREETQRLCEREGFVVIFPTAEMDS
jgi:hypothetical protein